MADRLLDRLAELLGEAEGLVNNDRPSLEMIAVYLAENGVNIPVRCKECQYGKYYAESGRWHCRAQNGLNRSVFPDEYCAWGERVVGDGK